MEAKEKQEAKARFDTRISKEQKLFFEKAALLGGYRSLSDFIILTAHEKAKKIIQESETIIASKKDSEVFFKALMNAEKPNQKLIAASKDYKKLLSK
jgi:uncharacterized protein (DUF1778 family)